MDISARSASSQKVQEIEGVSTPKEKDKISGYRMILTLLFLVTF